MARHGHQPAEELQDLMSSVADYADTTQKAQSSYGNQAQGKSKMTARLTTKVSIIALLVSRYSFYETVLREASLRLHQPPLIHMFRQGFLMCWQYRSLFRTTMNGPLIRSRGKTPEDRQNRRISEPALRRLTKGRREAIRSDHCSWSRFF